MLLSDWSYDKDDRKAADPVEQEGTLKGGGRIGDGDSDGDFRAESIASEMAVSAHVDSEPEMFSSSLRTCFLGWATERKLNFC